jgi:hypothetical protein
MTSACFIVSQSVPTPTAAPITTSASTTTSATSYTTIMFRVLFFLLPDDVVCYLHVLLQCFVHLAFWAYQFMRLYLILVDYVQGTVTTAHI